MTHVVHEYVLVKQFADEAERMLGLETDFGNGLAVSLSQDAAELLLRIVVRERDETIELKAGLEKLINAITKAAAGDPSKLVPTAGRLEDLNKARVAFKHAGIAPSRADAQRLVRWGVEFLEAAFPRFFQLEFRSISLAHQIKSGPIQEAVLEAERLLASGELRNCVVASADAVHKVECLLHQIRPRILKFGNAGTEVEAILKLIDAWGSYTLGALIGFSPVDLLRFKQLAPSVSYSRSGQQFVSFSNGPHNYTLAEAEFCCEFALGFAVSVEAALPAELVKRSVVGVAK